MVWDLTLVLTLPLFYRSHFVFFDFHFTVKAPLGLSNWKGASAWLRPRQTETLGRKSLQGSSFVGGSGFPYDLRPQSTESRYSFMVIFNSKIKDMGP